MAALCGVGSGKTSWPPQSAMYGKLLVSSVSRFQGSASTTSGRSLSIWAGSWIGMRVPGVKRPCLYGLRSTVYSSRSLRIPQ